MDHRSGSGDSSGNKGGLEKGDRKGGPELDRGLEKCHGKGGLEKGHGKGGLEKGHGKGGLEKGHGKGGLEKGHGKGGLEKGHGKGGLEKGHGKGGLEKGHGKGGLEKGHGKGGLKQSQDMDPQRLAHHARIQEEMASGWKPGWQDSRGRASKWARKDLRNSDPAVHARRQAYLQGQRPETRPAQERMKEGSQRLKKIKALSEKNFHKKTELYKAETDFQKKQSLQKRKFEAWNKATSSSSNKPEWQEEEEEEEEEEEVDEENL